MRYSRGATAATLPAVDDSLLAVAADATDSLSDVDPWAPPLPMAQEMLDFRSVDLAWDELAGELLAAELRAGTRI